MTRSARRPLRALVTALAATLGVLLAPAAGPVAATPLATADGVDGSISGTVTVPAGVEVTTVEVRARGTSVSTARYARPDSLGHYTLTGLPPGQYEVLFAAPGVVSEYWKDAWGSAARVAVDVRSGADTPGIDATLIRGATVTGTVRVPPGFDPTRVTVAATGVTQATRVTARPAADGTYTLASMIPDSYAIQFTAAESALADQAWPASYAPASPPTIALVDGEVRTEIDADIVVGGRIAGSVQIPPGLSIPHLYVNAYYASGSGTAATAAVGPDGRYLLEGLPTGSYTLQFAGNNEVGGEYLGGVPLKRDSLAVPVVLSETTSGVDATLGLRTTASVTARTPWVSVGSDATFDVAVAAPGGGTPTGTVRLTRPDGTVLGTGTLANGKATIVVTGLPVGTHTIEASYLGDATYAPAVGYEYGFRVEALPLPSIDRVTPPNGSYLGGTRVTLMGYHLDGTTAVTFGGIPGTDLEVIGAARVNVTAPAGAVGTVPVVATTPGGTSATTAATVFSNLAVVGQTPVRALADWTVPPDVVRCVQIAGRFGVPAEADGVMLNVASVRPTGPGNVVVYPDTDGNGATRPPVAATVNFEAGADVANSAFVALPANGSVCYSTQGARTSGVVLDVSGYTLPGSGVVLQTPQRLIDTRHGAPELAPTAPRRLYTVDVAGQAGVPEDATAVLVNVTVQGGSGIGNLRVFPSGTAVPGTSILNYAPGQEKGSSAIVGLGPDGGISFWSDTNAPLGVIIDVAGYVEASSSFTAVGPTRILDTRSTSRPLPTGTVYWINVRELASLPAEATAVVLSVAAIQPATGGNLRVFPFEGYEMPRPGTSTINYIPGRDIANQSVVALPSTGTGLVAFYSESVAPFDLAMAVDVVGYFSAGPAD